MRFDCVLARIVQEKAARTWLGPCMERPAKTAGRRSEKRPSACCFCSRNACGAAWDGCMNALTLSKEGIDGPQEGLENGAPGKDVSAGIH